MKYKTYNDPFNKSTSRALGSPSIQLQHSSYVIQLLLRLAG